LNEMNSQLCLTCRILVSILQQLDAELAGPMAKNIIISGTLGLSGHREVLVGFAPAHLLHSLSFADTLDEDTGRGYQRRFNPQHSLDFRRYIQHDDSSTIPLTFNLRPRRDNGWQLTRGSDGSASLLIQPTAGKVFAQVDCQHRLGYLNDLSISLPFMSYLGLSDREEMAIFNIINSKARGLSTSLLDFHEATLAGDLAAERPELFIALQMNNMPQSPWHRQLDLGGDKTSGLTRRASLRTMQKAIKRFLFHTKFLRTRGPEAAAQTLIDFWCAVALVVSDVWDQPRRHLLTKGVGVYALTSIAGDLYLEASDPTACDRKHFAAALSDFLPDIDWSNEGALRGLGGEAGVKSAVEIIRGLRGSKRLRIVTNG
jgi:DNA sulfur modification protein DndB